MKIETLEKALEVIKGYESENLELKDQLKNALKGKEEAESIATDATGRLSKLEETLPKKLTAKVDKKEYEVLFGVDGLSKEELAEDKKKLAELVKFGSSAIKLVEE